MLNAENMKLDFFPDLLNAKIKFVIDLAAMSGSYLVRFEGIPPTAMAP